MRTGRKGGLKKCGENNKASEWEGETTGLLPDASAKNLQGMEFKLA